MLVVWLAPTRPAPLELLRTPAAQVLSPAELRRFPESALLELGLELEEAGRRLAVGRAGPTDFGPEQTHLVLQDSGRTSRIPRLLRPAVRGHAFFAPERVFPQRIGAGVALHLGLLRPCVSALRSLQAWLDLTSLRHLLDGTSDAPAILRSALQSTAGAPPQLAEPRLQKRLLEQSRLLADLSFALAGQQPQRLLLLENLWLGSQAARNGGDPPPWHQAPAQLDLLELAFSQPFAAQPSLSRAAAADQLPDWIPASPKGELTPEEPLPSWLLSKGSLRQLQRALYWRLRAASAFAAYLFHGSSTQQRRADECLTALQTVLSLPHSWAASWRAALDRDRDLVRVTEPFRIKPWAFEVLDRRQSSAVRLGQITTYVVDDSRFCSAAKQMAAELEGFPLQIGHWSDAAENRLLLRTYYPSADARNLRVSMAGSSVLSWLANGQGPASEGQRWNLQSGHSLQTTLALSAGRNQLDFYVSGDAQDTLRLRLTPLPGRLEGTTLDPERAEKVTAPMANLRHPLSQHGTILAIPRARHPPDQLTGSATFFVESRTDRRVDLWLHGLSDPDTSGKLFVRLRTEEWQALVLPPGQGWSWARLAAPLRLKTGGQALQFRCEEPGILVDSITLSATGLQFPRNPPGNLALYEFAWRFDPLGAGQVLLIPRPEHRDRLRQTFVARANASYRVFVWMRGTEILQPGDYAGLEFQTLAGRQVFQLSAGSPVEEWVQIGVVSLVADEKVDVRAFGDGHPVALAILP